MKNRGTQGERLNAVTAAMIARQIEGTPVHEWPFARLEEAGGWKHNYYKVEQYMTTEIISVHEDEPVDLVANLMEWERIRHVPVEDHDHRLVGLVSYRAILRLLGQGGSEKDSSPIAVSEIMRRDPITVGPDAPTLEAIDLMRRHQVGCLPVVQEGRLVGIVTEHDFMDIAAELLEGKLQE
jgi:CBS domain-containing protein